MGFGQSKKESVESQADGKMTRVSKQSSDHSIISERFVSPPTSPVPGFRTTIAGARLGPAVPKGNGTAVDAVKATPATVANQKAYLNVTELETRLVQVRREHILPKTCNETMRVHQRNEQQIPQQRSQKNPLQQMQQLPAQHELQKRSQQQRLQGQCPPQGQQQQQQQQQRLQHQQRQQQQDKLSNVQPQQSTQHLKQQEKTEIQTQQPPQQQHQQKQPHQLQIEKQKIPQQRPKQHTAQQPQNQMQQRLQLQQQQKETEQTERHPQHLQGDLKPSSQHQRQPENQELQTKIQQHGQQQLDKAKQQRREHLSQQDCQDNPNQLAQPRQQQKLQQVQQQNPAQQREKLDQQQQKQPPLQQQPVQQQQQKHLEGIQQRQQDDQDPARDHEHPRKTKKQLKKDQRVIELQIHELAKTTPQLEPQQSITKLHQEPQQDQQQQQTQPQDNQQNQQRQSKPQDRKTLQPLQQPEIPKAQLPSHQPNKLQQPKQPDQKFPQQEKQKLTVPIPEPSKPSQKTKQEQLSNKTANKQTINLASTYKSNQSMNSKDNCPKQTIGTSQVKPVPLMAINFTKQGSNHSLHSPPQVGTKATVPSKQPTPSSVGAPAQTRKPSSPPKQKPRATLVNPTLATAKCQATKPSDGSQKTAERTQTPNVPRKQKSKTACNSGCQQLPAQSHQPEQNKGKGTQELQILQEQEQSHRQQKEQQLQQQHEQQRKLQRQQKDSKPQPQQQQQSQQQLQKQQKQQQQQSKAKQEQLQQQDQNLQQQQEQQQCPPEKQSATASFVFQGGQHLKNAVREPNPHPTKFLTSAAALQAELALKGLIQQNRVARKHNPVEGDDKIEIFNSSLAQNFSSSQNSADVHPSSNTDSLTSKSASVASWAIVCDKMPEQDIPCSKSSAVGANKKEHRRRGRGFFSKVFGRKLTTASKTPPSTYQKSTEASADLDNLSIGMQSLTIDPSTSGQPIEGINQSIIGPQNPEGLQSDGLTAEVLPPPPDDQQPDGEAASSSADSDDSSDLEPPSCLEAWEIADDIVEKALSLLPIQIGSVQSMRFTVPECPFEPEIVQRLVSDALEAKRGLKRIKEDQKVLEAFRDCLLKFFENKTFNDVLPPCNHPAGANRCNMQPVIQPMLDIIRLVLREPSPADEQTKEAEIRSKETEAPETCRRQPGRAEPRPRKYIKIRRKLDPGQPYRTPIKLLVRFCNACGDTKQPDGKQLMSCNRCQDVVYCTKECQNVDWITHKFSCPGGDRRSYCKHHGT